ncbi:MAG: B12-binding domain-containing radical SAM protein [Candidatus Bathyarchaeum sp.]|nr:MAG: B12-binding domain-containing radical SAM protein [Candidatus Bathyarchaeum sp.]
MTTDPPKESPWGLGRRFPPLGLAYVAGALEQAGFQVELLDNYLLKKPIEDVKQEVKRLAPEMLGMTCGSVTYRRCIETAKAVKEVLPACKVVVGGWHPSYLPESMLQHPAIDYVVMGEGERAIVELAKSITKGEDDSAIAKISGLAYRRGEKITKNAPTFISDLDQVPFPARHLLPMHLYSREMEYLSVKPVDTMNVIRGCPYNCAFCETKKLWGSKCRAFSPSRVVEELNHLVSDYGTKGIYFVGDNFTIHKKRTIELCREIKKSKLDLEWVCDTRVDLISRELLKEMKAAGCRTIWFGVESGSSRILKKINKQISLQQALDAFKLCREEEIRTASSFMLGLPGETVKDMETSFKFARKLDPDWVRFNIFVGYPGSDLYDEIMAKGLYDRVEDFVTYVKTDDFNYEMVSKIQKRFHKKFNRSPKRILRTIRRDGFLNVLRRNL